MPRERLLLDEMISAVERIIELVDDRIEDQIAADRTTRDAAVSDVPEFIAAQDLIVTQETVILNS
jgi:uncharacterized protein with HEPN domain